MSPTDQTALTKAVLTIVANSPVLMGQKLQLPKQFLFRREGQHECEQKEETLLDIEGAELRPGCGVLQATDDTGIMWACVIYLTSGRLRRIADEQLLGDYPEASTIVFEDVVEVRVQLQNKATVVGQRTAGRRSHKLC